MSTAIGIDIGGTYVKFVAISREGQIVYRSRLSTNNSSVEGWPEQIHAEVAKIERELGRVQAVAVACPGLVCSEGDAIYWMKGRLNILEGLSWREILHRPQKVPVINDAHAALKAETWLGAGRGRSDVVMLTLGTGVGGAILCEGRILKGSTGRAGHFGHTALNITGEKDIANTPGSLEDAIGDWTVQRRSNGRFASTAQLVEAHLDGDAIATTIWQTSVQFLAAALASIINSIDPQRIILGGGVASHAGQALFAPLRKFMDEYEWRPNDKGVEIVLAELGDEAGAIGSARHAMECYDANRTVLV